MVIMKRVSDKCEREADDFAGYGMPEISMVGRYNYNQAHPPLKPHMHKNIFEVCFLERGAQAYFVGSTRYDLAGGDIFITKPGEIHGTGREPENKGRLYWIEFKHTQTGESFLGLTPQESQVLFHRLLALPVRHFHNGHILALTFERIFSAQTDRSNSLHNADLRNLILRLILDMVAIMERRLAHPYSIGIQSAIRHIEQNPANLPGIAQLARVAGMSESYFKIVFKKETGMPPVEYANWRRVEKAKRLLQASSFPVTSIAMDLGFATSQHFATVFKRLTGLSPTVFRERAHLRSIQQVPLSGAGPSFHPSDSEARIETYT